MKRILTYAKKIHRCWRQQGTLRLFLLVTQRVTKGRIKVSSAGMVDFFSKSSGFDIVHARFDSLSPLQVYALQGVSRPRVNVVTDSIGASSLFGGVGTALILAALLANRLGAQLRIITRTETPDAASLDSLLALYGIKLANEVQFKFAAYWDKQYALDVGDKDLFLTTSWWSTAATLPSVPAASIVYLLQEDERMFYPFGDDRRRCDDVLHNRDIRFVINTKLLFDHFVQTGLDNIATNGMWFEPAFPTQIFHPRRNAQKDKLKFFFYARPNNPRNLFHMGIEIIEQAILEQAIDLKKWDIYLVGKNIPTMVLGDGYEPKKCEDLNWGAYADLIGTVDLGLSLMYTPHPSYPPLDLAASGAIVVTNKFANKQDLGAYSKNIICADLDRDAMVDALRQGVKAALDAASREANHRANGMLGDWAQALNNVVEKIAGFA